LVNDSLPLRTEADRFNTKSRDCFRFRHAAPALHNGKGSEDD
jgi:hypothetical protein